MDLVQELDVFLDEALESELDMVGLLPKALFPKLKALSITVEDCGPLCQHHLVKLLHGLVTPSLRNLHIDSSLDYLMGGPPPEILCHVKSNTGSLETLSLVVDRILPPQDQAAILEIIRSNPNLCELTIADTSPNIQAAFEAASRLPKLEYLSFCRYYDREGDPRIQPIPGGFPSLRNFRSYAATTSFPHILRSLPASSLEELNLWSNYESVNPEVNLHLLSNFIHIKTLDLHIESTVAHTWEGILQHILVCSKLESLSLATRNPSQGLCDSMMLVMAQAWPRLRHLDLIRIGDSPTVTLQGLAPLAQFCPGLECLNIAVDARGLPEQIDMPHIGLAVTELELARWSPLDERRDRVVDFVCRMWPNQSYENRPPGDWDSIWSAVNTRLHREAKSGKET